MTRRNNCSGRRTMPRRPRRSLAALSLLLLLLLARSGSARLNEDPSTARDTSYYVQPSRRVSAPATRRRAQWDVGSISWDDPTEGRDVSFAHDGGVLKTVLVPAPIDAPGPPPKGSRVSAHYIGTLASTGKKFDSSRDRGSPFEFTLGRGEVIQGWDEGIASMKVGERARLLVRSDYGYGNTAMGDDLPANSDLVFDVELLDFWDGGSGVPGSAAGRAEPPTDLTNDLYLHGTLRSSYYCGERWWDWNDFACGNARACPTGSDADCPAGLSCFADTPCGALKSPPPTRRPASEPDHYDTFEGDPRKRFCGKDWADVVAHCETAVPCHDGFAEGVCPVGTVCISDTPCADVQNRPAPTNVAPINTDHNSNRCNSERGCPSGQFCDRPDPRVDGQCVATPSDANNDDNRCNSDQGCPVGQFCNRPDPQLDGQCGECLLSNGVGCSTEQVCRSTGCGSEVFGEAMCHFPWKLDEYCKDALQDAEAACNINTMECEGREQTSLPGGINVRPFDPLPGVTDVRPPDTGSGSTDLANDLYLHGSPRSSYYCGERWWDWNDFACGNARACPTGSDADCPAGLSCFADTPCAALRSPPPTRRPASEPDHFNTYEGDPRKRYCGRDWADVVSRCETAIPCPSGSAEGVCPDDTICIADTPCADVQNRPASSNVAPSNTNNNVDFPCNAERVCPYGQFCNQPDPRLDGKCGECLVSNGMGCLAEQVCRTTGCGSEAFGGKATCHHPWDLDGYCKHTLQDAGAACNINTMQCEGDGRSPSDTTSEANVAVANVALYENPPGNEYFCGVNFGEVEGRCLQSKPCPGGFSKDVCAPNDGCFLSTRCRNEYAIANAPPPTPRPTLRPFRRPTPPPTRYPTPSPSKRPTPHPTQHPSERPTPYPTPNPTQYPSARPTPNPTLPPSNPPVPASTSPPTHPPVQPTPNPAPDIPLAPPTLPPSPHPTLLPEVASDKPTPSSSNYVSSNDATDIGNVGVEPGVDSAAAVELIEAASNTCSLCGNSEVDWSKTVDVDGNYLSCGDFETVLADIEEGSDRCLNFRAQYFDQCCYTTEQSSGGCGLCEAGIEHGIREDVTVRFGGDLVSCADLSARIGESYLMGSEECTYAKNEHFHDCCFEIVHGQKCSLCDGSDLDRDATVFFSGEEVSCGEMESQIAAEEGSRCDMVKGFYSETCCGTTPAEPCNLCASNGITASVISDAVVSLDGEEKTCSEVYQSLHAERVQSSELCIDAQRVLFDMCCDPTSGETGDADSGAGASPLPTTKPTQVFNNWQSGQVKEEDGFFKTLLSSSSMPMASVGPLCFLLVAGLLLL